MSNPVKNGLDNMMFFFKRVFKKNNLMLNEGKKEIENQNVKDNSRQIDSETQIENSVEAIKAENRKKQITKEIIDLVDKNPKALNYLNNEQLTFIDNYYVEDIKKLDESIKSIQKDIEDLDRLIELCKKMSA